MKNAGKSRVHSYREMLEQEGVKPRRERKQAEQIILDYPERAIFDMFVGLSRQRSYFDGGLNPLTVVDIEACLRLHAIPEDQRPFWFSCLVDMDNAYVNNWQEERRKAQKIAEQRRAKK